LQNPFKLVASSVELALVLILVVSFAYKIGLDGLFIKNGTSLIYKGKVKGPSIEPYGTLV
jgi:hypothetical protein